MKIKVLLILLFLLVCWLIFNHESVVDTIRVEKAKTEMEFDKTKWKTKKGWGYAYRNEMVNDLMNDPEVKALKKDEVLDLLGEPDFYRIDSNYLYYLIDQKRALLLPLHTKTLVIKLPEDSTIEWMKIHE